MNILNERPENRFFNDKTGTNPDFRKTKVNNSQAFRAMFEIIIHDGKIDDPNFDPDLREMIQRGMFYKTVKNGDVLAKKLQQFLDAWEDIKQDAKLRAGVSSMISGFHTSWPEYVDAIPLYCDVETFPIYFDVAEYLNNLLDDDGNINPDAKKTQAEYTDLAVDWRAELNQQYQAYAARKNNDDENA